MEQQFVIIPLDQLKAVFNECVGDRVQKIVSDAIESIKPKKLFADYPEFVDINQATEMLGISNVTLHAWCKQNKIKKYKMHGLVRLKRDEIGELITKNLVKKY